MKEEIVASQKLKAPLPPLKDKASICQKLSFSFVLTVLIQLAAINGTSGNNN